MYISFRVDALGTDFGLVETDMVNGEGGSV